MKYSDVRVGQVLIKTYNIYGARSYEDVTEVEVVAKRHHDTLTVKVLKSSNASQVGSIQNMIKSIEGFEPKNTDYEIF